MSKYEDRVKEITGVTGAGAATLNGAVVGFRAVASVYGVGDRVPYVIDGGAQWEVGSGTLVDATTLARTTVLASSNGGALVDFSAGQKSLFVTVPASDLNKVQTTDTVAFSTAVPLREVGARFMPQQNVAGALAFTVAAGAVQGALVYLRLVANGTNAPTFTGMLEHGGSQGYDNRAGIVNIVQFFYDGLTCWYSISQAQNVAPGAPTIGIAVAGDGYVDVAFTAPSSDGGAAITSYTATLSTGETATGTTSPIRVTASNGTARTANVKATNSVGTGPASAESNSVTPVVGFPRLQYLNNMTEAGTGPYTYSSASAGATGFLTKGGLLNKRLQSGIDGSFSFKNETYTELMLGITTTTNATVNFASMPAALYAKTTVNYQPWTNGTGGTATNAVARQANDIVRLRRVGSSLVAEVARAASPETFTEIYTWTGISTAALAFMVNVNSTGQISELQTSGLL